MQHLPEQLLNGLQLGSIYALIALGYTMVYGVLKLINFSHGDVYMVGAYTGLGASTVLGLGLASTSLHVLHLHPSVGAALLVLIVAMLACALLGLVIEQAAYRPLRTRAWIAPTIFLGAAVAYIFEQIVEEAGGARVVAILVGLAVWAALGLLLRTTQSRRAPGSSSRLTALITAIGVSLFLENFANLRQIFTSDPQYFPTIVNLGSGVHLGGLSVSAQTLVIFGLSLVLMGVLTYIITRTKAGKAIRAVSFDPDAAALMGINTDRVIAFTFALGAALAGAAGVMVSAFQGTAFNPYVGINYGLKAFVAAVLGGIGNIPGAMLGGLIMGVAETLVAVYGQSIGIPSTYRDAVAFFLLILILLVRPSGLLGKVTVEKV